MANLACLPAEDWARWLTGVPSSPELCDCVMPSHSALAQLLLHSVRKGSREGPSHGEREGGRGHLPCRLPWELILPHIPHQGKPSKDLSMVSKGEVLTKVAVQPWAMGLLKGSPDHQGVTGIRGAMRRNKLG